MASLSETKWLRNEGTVASRLGFALLLLFIAAVSVHDAVLVVLHEPIILEVEKNPLGRWLLVAGDGSVWLFVSAKMLGTAVACAVLTSLYQLRRSLGLASTSGVAVFQTSLLIYLCLY